MELQEGGGFEAGLTVLAIRERHGRSCIRRRTIANKFASEWAAVLSVSHRVSSKDTLFHDFDKFAQIPAKRCLAEEVDVSLLAPITEWML